jgi:hypothetical protein
MDAQTLSLLAISIVGTTAAGVFSLFQSRERRRRSRAARMEEQLLEGLSFPDRGRTLLALEEAGESASARRRVLGDALAILEAQSGQQSKEAAASGGTGGTGGESGNEPGTESAEERIALLESRVADLSSRLPGKDIVPGEMTATEARMGVLIEHLERDLDRLSKRSLNRGDVVLLFFATLTPIAALLALVPWILSLYGN